MSPIVEPYGEDDRRRQQRIDLARKALWLREISVRTDGNGYISPQAENEAAIAAGVREAPAPPSPEVRLARLEAGDRHDLRLDQIDQMVGTTDAEIELEARALAPSGDGGARGNSVAPPDPVAEAEQAGDWTRARQLKAQMLLDRQADQAMRNHPNYRNS